MSMRCRIDSLCLVQVCAIAGLAGAASGQAEPPDPDVAPVGTPQTPPTPAAQAPQLGDWTFVLFGGASHQVQTDVDGGGDFSLNRFNAGINVIKMLNEDLRMSLRFDYNLDLYDFGGGVFGLPAGLEPWDDIHTADAAALFSWRVSEDFTLVGGPLAQFARESDVDWSNSASLGGFAGATYAFSKDLTAGLGLVIMDEIEDDIRVSVLPIINWQLGDNWRIGTQTLSSAYSLRGVELTWDVGGGWETAFGGAFQYSRFRLDSDGPAPEGVGENESMPFWLRLTYNADRLRIDALAGLNTAGELRLEDEDGDKLAQEDFDMTPFVGLFASFRF